MAKGGGRWPTAGYTGGLCSTVQGQATLRVALEELTTLTGDVLDNDAEGINGSGTYGAAFVGIVRFECVATQTSYYKLRQVLKYCI